MKVVVIGGGIAGLSLGIFLIEKKIEVVICERFTELQSRGHAFLMHRDGIAPLKRMNYKCGVLLPARKVDEFILKRPDDSEVKDQRLSQWYCIKRADLLGFQYSLYPLAQLKEGRIFSHFIVRNNKAIAAVFENGDVEYGDIFVGADGGNSKVRGILFDDVTFTPVQVKEIVGIVTAERIASSYPNIFTKFQDKTNGRAFGFIPTSDTELVWFMQYDPSIADLTNNTAEALRSFCFKFMYDFPEVVHEILRANDFTTSYVWETKDFDLLPSFHKQNVVLIGDAAHLALPFTSAGTTNAIVDAQTLVKCLGEDPNYETAFNRYYELRSKDIEKHLLKGRELKKQFLDPSAHNDDDIPLPLTIGDNEPLHRKEKRKEIQVLYFTDPICSTCWIIQPTLRKLKLEYDNYINIEYCMGGLLSSWDEYSSSKIMKPTDAARHWEEVGAEHGMPLDGDIWYEDPLTSSYPPSIAFKAAQMQDPERAILFLRRIKEMVFTQKKNIIKWEHLRRAAFDVGLDSARLLRDYEGRAKELFRQDILLSQQLGVKGFPTLFFSNGDHNKFVLRGLQPYERFESIIHQMIPDAKKESYTRSPEELFSFFPTMTEKEFVYLGNLSKEEAKIILNSMYRQGSIDKYESKNGTIWISKQKAA
jgi:2-polyprenyl-6-methoxyphenol hydroxylase-like FAD-dependent oxidoreductase/predicted DsbA family dithiol-disulfide isomerase